ncbi:MAG TPA: MMPL family transporter [Mycobacteriales bacterium]|nr:MMPL family transporter [Mycobacteriales bacterium]
MTDLTYDETVSTPPPVTQRPRGLGRLAEFVLRHRRWVVIGWLIVLVAGAPAAKVVSGRLSVDFSLPGQPGYETAKHLDAIYGPNSGLVSPTIAVVTAPDGQQAADQAQQLTAAGQAITAANPSYRVVDYGNTHDPRFIGKDGRTTIAMVFTPMPTSFSAPDPGPRIERAVKAALPGWQVGVTGLQQLASGGDSNGPGVLAETLIGGAGALIVLAFVFASFLALLPMLIAAVSILATFLIVLALTTVTEVSFIVEFLVALVGLGVAIDYSLLLVTRWREERERGRDNHDAVVKAVETAGHTVAVSGLTVGIGLLALIVLPVPGLRSVGIGGVLIPLVSVVVVLTLLPAVLGGVGPRFDWPRVRHEREASRVWTRWARAVVRWRWAGATLAAAILAILIVPVFGLKVGETSVDALAKNGAAHDAYVRMTTQGISPGMLTPLEVLTNAGSSNAAVTAAKSASGITTAVLPSGSQWSRAGTADVVAVPNVVTVNNDTLAPVRALQAKVTDMPGVRGVTGEGPVQQDYSHAVFGNFPLMFALIAIATLLLLMRAFRSVTLAIKAVVLNLVSMAATFGFLTWFWQSGHGSNAIFGVPATGAITFWIPLMVFAFLFGLSMDYEVFILSRVREEYDGHDKGGNATDAAVVEGLGRTGRLVTSAALILFLAFASLASAPDTDVRVLATGLGVGILLDATVVRALLVPALVSLLGRWNWWLPRPIARVLRVAPSEAA